MAISTYPSLLGDSSSQGLLGGYGSGNYRGLLGNFGGSGSSSMSRLQGQMPSQSNAWGQTGGTPMAPATGNYSDGGSMDRSQTINGNPIVNPTNVSQNTDDFTNTLSNAVDPLLGSLADQATLPYSATGQPGYVQKDKYGNPVQYNDTTGNPTMNVDTGPPSLSEGLQGVTPYFVNKYAPTPYDTVASLYTANAPGAVKSGIYDPATTPDGQTMINWVAANMPDQLPLTFQTPDHTAQNLIWYPGHAFAPGNGQLPGQPGLYPESQFPGTIPTNMVGLHYFGAGNPAPNSMTGLLG